MVGNETNMNAKFDHNPGLQSSRGVLVFHGMT